MPLFEKYELSLGHLPVYAIIRSPNFFIIWTIIKNIWSVPLLKLSVYFTISGLFCSLTSKHIQGVQLPLPLSA